MKKILAVVVLCFGLSSIGALAHEGGHDGPCKDDRVKFCKDLKGGKGLWKCMNEHHDSLSDGCKAMMAKRQEKHAEEKKVEEKKAE